MERKPGFVLSAFDDNAGFIALDDNLAVCLKAETHNHPPPLNRTREPTPGWAALSATSWVQAREPSPSPPWMSSASALRTRIRQTSPPRTSSTPGHHARRGARRARLRQPHGHSPPSTAPSSLTPRTFTTPRLLRHRRRDSARRHPEGNASRPPRSSSSAGARDGTASREPRSLPPLWMKPPMRKTSPPCKSVTRLKRRKRWTSFWKRANAASSSLLRTAAPAAFSSAAGEMLSVTGGEIFLDNALSRNRASFPGKSSCRNPRNAWLWPWRKRPSGTPEAGRHLPDGTDRPGPFRRYGNPEGLAQGELVCCLDNSKLHDAPIKLESVFTPGKALTGQPLPDKDLNKSWKPLWGISPSFPGTHHPRV